MNYVKDLLEENEGTLMGTFIENAVYEKANAIVRNQDELIRQEEASNKKPLLSIHAQIDMAKTIAIAYHESKES